MYKIHLPYSIQTSQIMELYFCGGGFHYLRGCFGRGDLGMSPLFIYGGHDLLNKKLGKENHTAFWLLLCIAFCVKNKIKIMNIGNFFF